MALTQLPITTEEWIAAWLNLYEPEWRFGFEGMVLVGDLEDDRGPWFVEHDPDSGMLVVDGVRCFSACWR